MTGARAGLLTGVVISVGMGPFGLFLPPVVIPVSTLGVASIGTVSGWSAGIPAGDVEAANAALSRFRSDLSAEVARRVASRLPSVGKMQ